MASVARLSEEVRKAVADELRGNWGLDGFSLRDVADRHGISPGSVRNIAHAAGITAHDARERSKNATEQMILSNAQRRAVIGTRLLRIIESTMDEIESELEKPSPVDRKHLMTTVGIGVDKHKVLEHFDADQGGSAELDKYIRSLTGQ